MKMACGWFVMGLWWSVATYAFAQRNVCMVASTSEDGRVLVVNTITSHVADTEPVALPTTELIVLVAERIGAAGNQAAHFWNLGYSWKVPLGSTLGISGCPYAYVANDAESLVVVSSPPEALEVRIYRKEGRSKDGVLVAAIRGKALFEGRRTPETASMDQTLSRNLCRFSPDGKFFILTDVDGVSTKVRVSDGHIMAVSDLSVLEENR